MISGRSPWAASVRRFRANKLALWSIYVIAILVLAALLAPLLAPHDPVAIADVMGTRFQSPSWAHPFGTDEFGRDVFSRTLYGARVSLSVGIVAMLLATSIGSIYGAIAGFFGGIVDGLLMRIVDVWIAFPAFYLMLLLVGVFEASVPVLIAILALTAWPATARLIRAEILSLREREYVEAARAMGLPAHRIITRHLIPGALSPVLVTAALAVAAMIGAEAGLSFLGLGISPPTPSWGNMVAAGRDTLASAWWISFFPGAFLTITLIAFSLVADGLRDALDPKALDQKFV
jgi:peptide/nickel transport system permease protein